MYIKNLEVHHLKKMKELALEAGVFNSEAQLYVFHKNSFPDRVVRVFKYMDAQDFSDVMERKEFTVTTLNQLEEYLSIRRLVIPDTLVYLRKELVGFSLPLIPEHRNVGKMLQSNIPFEDKRDCLIQIGDIIQEVQDVKGTEYRFQFGDLNEYNFIMNRKGRIKTIDLDSSYLGVGEPSELTYYLLRNPYIRLFPTKYPISRKFNIVPTDDTDLFCYHMMVLKVLSGEDFSVQSKEVFEEYLSYLKTLDIPEDFITSFESLYSLKPNGNPKDSLMGISSSTFEKMSFESFQKTHLKK